jgi:rare lipoprotein A
VKTRSGNPTSYEQDGEEYHVLETSEGYREIAMASWYGQAFQGRRTSSGEPYDMYRMTAAHKTLPLPTYVRVTNLGNGRSVVVRVNDRGPFIQGRIIDLSFVAAQRLDMVGTGTARVEVVALDPPARDPGF